MRIFLLGQSAFFAHQWSRSSRQNKIILNLPATNSSSVTAHMIFWNSRTHLVRGFLSSMFWPGGRGRSRFSDLLSLFTIA